MGRKYTGRQLEDSTKLLALLRDSGMLDSFETFMTVWFPDIHFYVWQEILMRKFDRQIKNTVESINRGEKAEPMKSMTFGSHGMGKTFFNNLRMLYILLLASGSKTTVLLPAIVQFKAIQYPDIMELINGHPILKSVLCVQESSMTIHTQEKIPSYLFVKSTNVRSSAGQHASSPLPELPIRSLAGVTSSNLIIGEMSAISDDIIYQMQEGYLTDNVGFALYDTNITVSQGFVHDVYSGKLRGDRILRVPLSLFDNNLSEAERTKLLEQKVQSHGLNSDIVRVRYLGFPPNSTMGVMWTKEILDKAILPFNPLRIPEGSIVKMAIDVAGDGSDGTVIGIMDSLSNRECSHIILSKSLGSMTPVQLTEVVQRYMVKYRVTKILVDYMGVGAGYFSQLRGTLGHMTEVAGFNFSHRFKKFSRFTNLRASSYYSARDSMEAGRLTVSKSYDEVEYIAIHNKVRKLQLKENLSSLEREFLVQTSVQGEDGRISLVSKAKLRSEAKILYSPDNADVVAMLCSDGNVVFTRKSNGKYTATCRRLKTR